MEKKKLHFPDCQKNFFFNFRLEKLIASESQIFEMFTSDREAHTVERSYSYHRCLWKQKDVLGFCKYVLPTYLQHTSACLRCRLQLRVEMLRISRYSGMEFAVTSLILHRVLQPRIHSLQPSWLWISAGVQYISQRYEVVTSQVGRVQSADTYGAGEIILAEVCF